MIYSKHTYILKNRNINYGTIINDKSYVIAFRTHRQANNVSKIIDTNRNIILFPKKESVYIAKTYIPITINKRQIFKPSKILVNDFMEYPNINNIGIIYAMDIDYNGELLLEFSSLVIEPLNNIEAYRENLCKSRGT